MEIYERHEVISEFLTTILHVDPETADKDACHMEHVVSDSTFQGLKKIAERSEGTMKYLTEPLYKKNAVVSSAVGSRYESDRFRRRIRH